MTTKILLQAQFNCLQLSSTGTVSALESSCIPIIAAISHVIRIGEFILSASSIPPIVLAIRLLGHLLNFRINQFQP